MLCTLSKQWILMVLTLDYFVHFVDNDNYFIIFIQILLKIFLSTSLTALEFRFLLLCFVRNEKMLMYKQKLFSHRFIMQKFVTFHYTLKVLFCLFKKPLINNKMLIYVVTVVINIFIHLNKISLLL